MARYGCTVTVDTGKMPSSQSNFAWLLTEDNFPTAAIDGGSTSILNGGGNLRCYTDDTKTTQLPIEVVTFVTGVAPNVQVWGLSPTLGVGGTVYIEADTVAVSQPSVTDTYGRNAVWVNTRVNYHLESTGAQTDVTGNGYDLTESGGATTQAGKIGNSIVFNGVNTHYVNTAGIRPDSSFTINTWVKAATGSVVKFIWDDSSGSSGGVQTFVQSDGTIRTRIDDSGSNVSIIDTTSTVNDDIWHMVTLTVDKSGNATHYIDGVQNGDINDISTFGNIAPTGDFTLGKQYAVSSYFTGGIDETRLDLSVWSVDYITSEYNNQSSPSTFWTTSAWEDQDAGGAITVTGQTPNVTMTSISASIDLTGEIQVLGATPNYPYAPIAGAIDLTGQISVTGQTVNYSISAENGNIDLTGELIITGSTPNYSITSVNGNVTLDALISVVGQTPNYIYSPESGTVDVTGEITVIGSTPDYLLTAIGGIVAIGDSQVIGTVTAGFKQSDTSVEYKKDEITTSFKLSGVTVNFKE